MKKIFIYIFLIIIFLFSWQIVLSLEVNYPSLPGAAPSEDLGLYVKYIFTFIISISGIIGLIVLISAGVRYLTSLGDAEKIKSAKNQLISAFWGIILLFGSYILLSTINPDLLSLKLPVLQSSPPSQEPPAIPINVVPTADLLMRIKILAEATKKMPEIIKETSDNIKNMTDQCDCGRTKPICVCESFPANLSELKPWYTAYGHMDKIYVQPGQEVQKGDIIGEVGAVGSEPPIPHLHFAVGLSQDENPGNSLYTVAISFDIYSQISALGRVGWPGQPPIRAPGTSALPLPSWTTQEYIDFILGTLEPPLDSNHCQWYELMGSIAHTDYAYWAQDWLCISDCKLSKELTESAKVYVMSGGENIKSTVVGIIDKGGVIIKHEIIPLPCYEKKDEPRCVPKTCYTGNISHPCPQNDKLKQKQKDIIDQRDIILYYKNRFVEEQKDLQRSIEKFINKELLWLENQITKTSDPKQLAFLNKKKAELEKEKEKKTQITNKIEEINKVLADYEEPTTKLPQLSARCFTDVKIKCRATCKEGTDYGCHDKSLGCQPDSCIGGNPCPKKEIIVQINEIKRLKDKAESLLEQIISIIESIKKEIKI